MPTSLALLGSTGSIGRNTLDVVAGLPGRFEVVGLAAGDNVEVMAEQVAKWRPRVVAMRTEESASGLRERLGKMGVAPGPKILAGEAGLLAVGGAGEVEVELLVAATVGVAALRAIHAALERGCGVALANKEALVVAGDLLLGAARRSGAALLPIDSEHSAIHQCLRSGQSGEIARLILTASGGPLLRHSAAQMEQVSPEEALRHPIWSMGARISLDSATLMNKGFEIIEACHLFGVKAEEVEVLIHRQCVVHSMVEFRDGSTLAQLGTADMRTPIQYALTYPERLASPRMRLELQDAGKLEFELPDEKRFPCLGLARRAQRAGGGSPAVLNAADEVAVAAFLGGAIRFPDIARVIEGTLDRLADIGAVDSVDAVLAADGRARLVAAELAQAS